MLLARISSLSRDAVPDSSPAAGQTAVRRGHRRVPLHRHAPHPRFFTPPYSSRSTGEGPAGVDFRRVNYPRGSFTVNSFFFFVQPYANPDFELVTKFRHTQNGKGSRSVSGC